MNEAKISFEGNIGTEPELRFLPSGQGVCEFSVAVNQRKKVGDEWKDTNTTWFRVAVWGKLAESAVELHKGSRVLIVGTLIAEEWEKDGKTNTSLKVTAEHVAPCLTVSKSERPVQNEPDPWAVAKHPTSDEEPPF